MEASVPVCVCVDSSVDSLIPTEPVDHTHTDTHTERQTAFWKGVVVVAKQAPRIGILQ